MAAHDIGTAAQLPLAVAIEIVAQGLRIRIGRSLVTLAGVVCGIAFLASVLTGSVVKSGVAQEQAARGEASRMLALFESESGLVRNRRIAVIVTSQPSPVERRLALAFRDAGAELLWFGPAIVPQAQAAVSVHDAVVGAGGVLLIGTAPADLASAIPTAARPVLAALDPPTISGATIVPLAWHPKPGEADMLARQATDERHRSWWVTGIALAVTAIGIANAMLMSVTERFREIGTMKCLGALSSFIQRIFFLESAFIGLIGGIAGILLGSCITIVGYGVTYGFALVLGGTAWGHLSGLLALGVVASVILAVGAAIYPATVASRMRPSAALRSSV